MSTLPASPGPFSLLLGAGAAELLSNGMLPKSFIQMAMDIHHYLTSLLTAKYGGGGGNGWEMLVLDTRWWWWWR